MRESLLRMEYFETYYYANVVHNVLNDTMDYLRNLNAWHEDREVRVFLQPFPKWSVLHDLSEFLIEGLMYENLDDVTLDAIVNHPESELWVDEALRHNGFQAQGFRQWLKARSMPVENISEDEMHEYHQDLHLTGELDDLLRQLSNEVFFLLFGNRVLLARLNSYIAGVVRHMKRAELAPEHWPLLERDGILARSHIPEWVRRAVFFRDRGMCAACNRDLSGLVTVNTAKHFDHIIPLAEGGINDVTNIQLLCETCNLTKGRKLLTTSNRYEAWYT